MRRSDADTRPACGLHTRNLWGAHAYPDGDSYSHRDSHGYSYGYGNRYADSYWGTASNSVTAAAPDTSASPVGRSGSEKILTISL